MNTTDRKLNRITQWWDRKNTWPLVRHVVAPKAAPNMKQFWPNEESEPDYVEYVKAQIAGMKQTKYLADSIPQAVHSWGGCKTPMTMSAYLGGKVRFEAGTMWIGPVVEDWASFRVEFDPENPWVKRSRRLIETQVEMVPDDFVPQLPALGDALTVFSLLRGLENLLMDVLEQPEIIERKIAEYGVAWTQAHAHFWNIYRARFPGDCCHLGWAPGRTFNCQCDFSTMISPDMFRHFVVPEINRLSEYLEYMPWHLDGPEEIRHLDTLLGIPAIRAIQIQPGTNRPPAASPLWLPEVKKIQAKGRNIYVNANSMEELEILVNTLAPQGVVIGLGAIANSAREQVMRVLERRYGPKPEGYDL